jgi:hypothetical protein
MCLRHYIALYYGACKGELQARREKRQGLQVPEVLIEASANIVVKVVSVWVCSLFSPLRQGDCPLLL